VIATSIDPTANGELKSTFRTYPNRLMIISPLDMLDQTPIDAAVTEIKRYAETLETVWLNAAVSLGGFHTADKMVPDNPGRTTPRQRGALTRAAPLHHQ
jgi:hypothetical protein